MSLPMTATRALLRVLNRREDTAEARAARVASRADAAPIPHSFDKRYVVTTTTISDRRVVTLTPRTGGSGTQLVYLHGGAYVSNLVKPHWHIINTLSRRSGATVTIPFYGLAPELTIDDALPFLREVADGIRDRHPQAPIVFGGDSAGGGLSLAHSIHARDTHTELPAALLLFSPWVETTMTNPEIDALVPLDPMLGRNGLVAAGEWWAGERSPADPLVSPINDSLRDLPPMFVYQGTHDLFAPDAVLFTRTAKAAGAAVELRMYPGAFHVFVGAGFTREARRALRHAAGQIVAARR